MPSPDTVDAPGKRAASEQTRHKRRASGGRAASGRASPQASINRKAWRACVAAGLASKRAKAGEHPPPQVPATRSGGFASQAGGGERAAADQSATAPCGNTIWPAGMARWYLVSVKLLGLVLNILAAKAGSRSSSFSVAKRVLSHA